MVNLLSRGARPDPFPGLDAPAWEALASRLGRCVPLRQNGGRSTFQAHLETIAGELDELENAPSLASASSLIEAIDQIRREWLASASASSADSSVADFAKEGARDSAWAGSLLCYFPGRSLSTGEAEVASRGYFDVLDRPPLWSWVAAAGRPVSGTAQNFEVGILAWVALEDAAFMQAGCQASAAPSLMPIEEVSEAIAVQWRTAAERGHEGA